MYQVLQATRENPTKKDFVKTWEEYLKVLNIEEHMKK